MNRMNKEDGLNKIKGAFSSYINNLYSLSSMTRFNYKTARYNDTLKLVNMISRNIKFIKSISNDDKPTEELNKLIEDRKKLIPFLIIRRNSSRKRDDIGENEIEEEIRKIDASLKFGELSLDGVVLPSHIGSFAIELGDSFAQLTLRNAVISTISNYEIFLAKVIDTHLRMNPDMLKPSDSDAEKIAKSSESILNMLFTYESVDQIIESLINKRVDSIMRQSFEEWNKNLFKDSKVNFVQSFYNVKLYSSYFQIRNIIVHNDSVVNSIFISKVDEEFRDGLQEGEKFNLNIQFFEKMVEDFALAGAMLINIIWKIIYPKESKARLSYMNEFIYFAMMRKNWILVEKISGHIMKDDGRDREINMIIYLNFCLSQKRLNKFSTVKQDLEDFEHSMYSDRLSLGVYALLDKFKELGEKIISCDIEPGHLVEWPILMEFRKSENFTEILRSVYENHNSNRTKVLDNVEVCKDLN